MENAFSEGKTSERRDREQRSLCDVVPPSTGIFIAQEKFLRSFENEQRGEKYTNERGKKYEGMRWT